MKISANSTANFAVPNFGGEWKERRVGCFHSGRYHTECTYVPDKNESVKDIAMAWKDKTGELPSKWIRKNNIYNQQGDKTYHLADYFYMPLNLIKASLEIERKHDKHYGCEEHSVAELARISKQADDIDAEKVYEAKLIDIAREKKGAKSKFLMREFLDNYKENFSEGIYTYY